MINIALYQPEIPQNTGSIIRTCAAFDCKLFIIHPCNFIWNEKFLKRAALDYIKCVDIIHVNNLNELPAGRIIGTSAQATNTHYDFKFQKNDIVLFGKESIGIPSDIKFDAYIKIPTKIRSLNLAVSVGIIASSAAIKLNQ